MEQQNLKNSNHILLLVGGLASFLAAFLHVAIIIGGAKWYRIFGAGEEMATMAEQGSWIPRVITFSIAVVLFIWGLYAFSGAGKFKELPFLKLGLVVISIIYLGRALSFIPLFVFMPEIIDHLLVWSSLLSLVIGLAYAVGTKQDWSSLD